MRYLIWILFGNPVRNTYIGTSPKQKGKKGEKSLFFIITNSVHVINWCVLRHRVFYHNIQCYACECVDSYMLYIELGYITLSCERKKEREKERKKERGIAIKRLKSQLILSIYREVPLTVVQLAYEFYKSKLGKTSSVKFVSDSLFVQVLWGFCLRKVGCRGKVCQLLLAGGLGPPALGKRYAADLGCTVCAVRGASPRVLTGSWADSNRRHWMSLDPSGSWRSYFGDPRLFWVPWDRAVLQTDNKKK